MHAATYQPRSRDGAGSSSDHENVGVNHDPGRGGADIELWRQAEVNRGPASLHAILVGVMRAEKKRSERPPRPTSASSLSRRQVVSGLGSDAPGAPPNPPPLHSSQPVTFKTTKVSAVPFGSSGPRMLIDYDSETSTPAPSDYSPVIISVDSFPATGRRNSVDHTLALRPVNKHTRRSIAKGQSRVPTTFGTAARFLVTSRPEDTPAPCDYSPVVVPVVRTGDRIEKTQLKDLYDAAAHGGVPQASRRQRPHSAGSTRRDEPMYPSTTPMTLTSTMSSQRSASATVALHAGLSVAVVEGVPANQRPLRGPSPTPPPRPLLSPPPPRSLLSPRLAPLPPVPERPSSRPGVGVELPVKAQEASSPLAVIHVCVRRLQGVTRGLSLPIVDPFVKVHVILRCRGGDGELLSSQPITSLGSYCKTYPVCGGDGDAMFTGPPGKQHTLSFPHTGSWDSVEVVLKVDVYDYGSTDEETLVGSGTTELECARCAHSTTGPCTLCTQSHELLDYICLLRNPGRALCGRVHLSVRAVLMGEPPTPVPEVSADSVHSALDVNCSAGTGVTLTSSPGASTFKTSPERTMHRAGSGKQLSVRIPSRSPPPLHGDNIPIEPATAPSSRTEIAPTGPATQCHVNVNDSVIVLRNWTESWPQGIVTRVDSRSSLCDVILHSGDTLCDIPLDIVRPCHQPYRPDDAIEVRLKDTGFSVKGTILSVHGSGLDLLHDVKCSATGLIVKDVPPSRIQFAAPQSSASTGLNPVTGDNTTGPDVSTTSTASVSGSTSSNTPAGRPPIQFAFQLSPYKPPQSSPVPSFTTPTGSVTASGGKFPPTPASSRASGGDGIVLFSPSSRRAVGRRLPSSRLKLQLEAGNGSVMLSPTGGTYAASVASNYSARFDSDSEEESKPVGLPTVVESNAKPSAPLTNRSRKSNSSRSLSRASGVMTGDHQPLATPHTQYSIQFEDDQGEVDDGSGSPLEVDSQFSSED